MRNKLKSWFKNWQILKNEKRILNNVDGCLPCFHYTLLGNIGYTLQRLINAMKKIQYVSIDKNNGKICVTYLSKRGPSSLLFTIKSFFSLNKQEINTKLPTSAALEDVTIVVYCLMEN